MSAERQKVRARLAVGLYRGSAIEDLPIEEVREDLVRLGMDPRPSIKLARRLAEDKAASPAADLLKKVEEAEALDAEIGEIENAPIEDVLTPLKKAEEAATVEAEVATTRNAPAEVAQTTLQKAEETAAVENTENASAEGVLAPLRDVGSKDKQVAAERAAIKTKADTRDVKPKRRRTHARKRRMGALGWAGSLAGVAACVVLLVIARIELPGRSSDRPEPAVVADQGTDIAVAGGAEAEGAAADRAAADGPSAPKADEEAESRPQAASARVRLQVAEPSRPAAESGAASEATADHALADILAALPEKEVPSTLDRSVPAAEPPENTPGLSDAEEKADTDAVIPPPRPNDAEVVTLADTVDDVEQETATLSSLRGAEPSTPPAEPPGLPAGPSPVPLEPTGVFVVDPDRAPTVLKELAEVRTDNLLAARTGEAGLRALGKKVVALIAFERDGARVEAALVEAVPTTGGRDSAARSFAGAESPAGARPPPALELLELPGRRE